MSVPLVFAPVVHQGHVLVDGGLVENVPIAAGRELCGERLIVVDVSELPIPEDQLSSALQVSAQTVRLLINRETARMLATLDRERDLLIQPDLAKLRSGDFDRVEEGIAAGEAKAQALQAALSVFAVSEPEYELWRKRQRRQLPADATIEFVDVIGHRSRTSQFVANQLSELKGSKLGSKNIERAINRTLGDGDYSRVSYRVVKQQDRYGLEVTPEDKPWGPTLLRFGFALEDDFEGRTGYQLGAEARRVGLNDYGAEARLRVDFGEVAGISARFLQPLGATSEYFIDNQLGYSARNILFGANNTPSGEYRLESSSLLLGFGYEPNERLQLRLGFESIHDNASIRLGDRNGLPDLDGDSARIAFGATYDDLNDAAFPRVGERWVLNLKNDLVSLGADGNNLTGSLGFDWVRSLGRHSVTLGGRFFATDGSAQNYRQQALLGGFGRLSGFRRDALAGDRAGLLRAIYYRRLTDGARLGSAPLYLGGSLEVGNAWDREQRFGGGEPVLAASMFLGLDTPFGPVFLAYGRNDLQQDQLYLNVGSLFAD
jgi:NTE family protein